MSVSAGNSQMCERIAILSARFRATAQHSGTVQKQLSLERDESTALRRKYQLLRNDILEEEHRHAALMLSNGQKHSDEDSGTGQRGRSKDVVRPERRF